MGQTLYHRRIRHPRTNQAQAILAIQVLEVMTIQKVISVVP
jgi:hypothetical protein